MLIVLFSRSRWENRALREDRLRALELLRDDVARLEDRVVIDLQHLSGVGASELGGS